MQSLVNGIITKLFLKNTISIEMMVSIKENTVSSIKWCATERVSQQGIQFVIGIIVARILSPDDYGMVGMLTIFITIGQSFVDCGFGNALVRKIDRTQEDCSTVFYFNIVVGILCYFILFLLSPYVALFFNIPLLEQLLKVLALSLFFDSLVVVQRARLTAVIDFKTQAIASFIASVLSGIFATYLAYNGWGVWALAYQIVSYSFVNMLILLVVARWKPSWEFSYVSFREMFSYGSKLLVSGLLNTVYREFTTIAVGKIYSAKDLGFYTRGRQIATLPSSNFTGILQRVTFPILTRYQNDDKKLIDVYRKYIRYTSLIIFFGLFYLFAISKPLVLILLTQKWYDSIIYLQIFCLIYLFDHISQINLNLLQVKGRSDLYLRLEVIKRIMSLSLLFSAIPFGVTWICLSQLIYGQIALFINTYYTGKLFSFGYIDQIKDFAKYLVGAVIACLPTFIISHLPMHNLIQIIIGLPISMFLYYMMFRKDSCMVDLIRLASVKITQTF